MIERIKKLKIENYWTNCEKIVKEAFWVTNQRGKYIQQSRISYTQKNIILQLNNKNRIIFNNIE